MSKYGVLKQCVVYLLFRNILLKHVTVSIVQESETPSTKQPMNESGSDGKLQQQEFEQSLGQDERPALSYESDVNQDAKPQKEQLVTIQGPDGKVQSGEEEETPQQQGTEPEHSEIKLEADEILEFAEKGESPDEEQENEPEENEANLEPGDSPQSALTEETREQQAVEPGQSDVKLESDEKPHSEDEEDHLAQ